MGEKVSIIIPIYNAEKTIENCLKSVLKQTYENIEIILVDDGSTDKSSDICHVYLKKYEEKIRYIYQINSGPASARNKGIEASKGKYIAFIDADDTVSVDMISTMVNTAEVHEAEMVICAYTLIDNDNKIDCTYNLPEGLYKGDETKEILYSLMEESNQGVPPYSPVRLTLRSIMMEQKLRFQDGLIRSEDYHFWTKVHTRLESVYLLSEETLYNYIINNCSITHRHIEKYWEGVLFIYDDLSKIFSDSSKGRMLLDIMLVKRALIALNNAVMCNSKLQAWKEIWQIVNCKELNLAVKALENTKTKKFKSFRRLIFCHGNVVVACKYMIEHLINNYSAKEVI